MSPCLRPLPTGQPPAAFPPAWISPKPSTSGTPAFPGAYRERAKGNFRVKAIKEGLKQDDKTLMKPAEGLTDDQINGLVAYMRAFKK